MSAKLTENSEPGQETARPESRPSWLVARGILLERGPRRTLAAATFVNMLGNGMFNISAALFYTRVVGLSITHVGLGMAVGAVVGLLSGIPIGHLADRRGPREVYRLTLLTQAVAMAAMVFVHSFWLFVLVLSLTELTGSGSQAARGPLVRGLAGSKPARFRAYLRAAVNLAGSLGALAAALVIQVDTRTAYTMLILGNAASFAVCAFIVSRLSSLPPVKAPAGAPRRLALRDYPFVVLTVFDGITSIQGKVLSFAVPLWIVQYTHAPRWFVGVTVLINTGIVVLFQMRASRGVETNADAGRYWRRAGVAFLLGMVLISLTRDRPAWLAVVMILAGIGVHTVGELWQAASSFELRYNLAPAHAQGQYSGLFGLGSSVASIVAPPTLALLCIAWGAPGWWVMGSVFVVIGLLMPLVIRWAERTRAEFAPAAADEL